MRNFARTSVLWVIVLMAMAFGVEPSLAAEQRFALVIGNDEYRAAKLATSANDAGLVADALQSAGFTVTGARNLDQATMRESVREFIGQVSAAGPDAVALIYLAGIGLQFQGENYFVPVDADIQRDVDVPLQAIRVSDFTQPLAALPGRVKIVILDAARQNPFGGGDRPLASGLALVDAVPGIAIAYNAAPGTVAPDEAGPYGAYATSLTEMIAAGGLGLDDLFARLRLRVSDLTHGAEVPWYVSQIDGPFFITERAADAPPTPNVMPVAEIRARPMRDFSNVDDAYAAALDRDTIDGYEQFLALYPNGPYSERVAGMLAVRREAIIWRRCVVADSPPAYWSYLRRYPQGPHAWDARRRLGELREAFEPPPNFAMYDFGVPPPPPVELGFFGGPVVMFVGPHYGPPPPPPLFFLPPRPREFMVLPAPPPPHERFFLPRPTGATVVPVFVRPPPTVAIRQAPPGPPSAMQGRQIPVTLPAAVTHAPPPGATVPGAMAPGAMAPGQPPPHPGPGSTLPQTPRGGPGGPPLPPPSSATVKPGTPPPPPSPGLTAPAPTTVHPAPPPHPTGPTTTVRPGPPPPPPPGSIAPAPTTVRPAPPPPPPPGSIAPAPTTVRPAPPPPPPAPPHPTAPVPSTLHPAPPPPPHPAGPPPGAMSAPPPPPHPAAAAPAPQPPPRGASAAPSCPPGKHLTPQGCK